MGEFRLTSLACACALGRTSQEVLARLRAHDNSGMIQLPGEIPGRTVYFGAVPGELPEVDEARFRTRTNALLRLGAETLRKTDGLDAFIGRYGRSRVAVVLGTSNTGVHEAQRHVEEWLSSGSKPEGFFMEELELGAPAEFLAGFLGTTGPTYSISTACSSSAKAFASAMRLINAGFCDAAIVGGADGLCRFALNGFNALGALSQGRCRPLAEDRDGINLGEGMALFTLERASACGGVGVGLDGVGESSDACHPTAPDPDGRGAEAAMRAALAQGGAAPEDVAYVNLHGTGTIANDAMEMAAVRRVFGQRLPHVESTKSLTGHCLGAAGAVEAALVWLKIAAGDVRGPALSNSFAFGGSNASVLLSPGT